MWKWTFDITFDSQVESPLCLMVTAETGKEAKERVMELAKQAVSNTVPVKDAKLVDLQEV